MLLQIQNLSKRFDAVTALSDVSLEIEDGESVGLIGPNGSGKTTLFNLISRFVIPTSGKVFFAGKDLSFYRRDEVAKLGLARSFQIPQLCSNLTVLENIGLGGYSKRTKDILNARGLLSAWSHAIDSRAIMDAVTFLRLGELKEALPARLSNFERRKVELARSLISKPKLILLDEPTSGFTQQERDAFTEIVHEISSFGISLLIIEHDLTLIQRVCTNVVVLDAGRKIAEAPPRLISEDAAVAEVYLGVSHVESNQAHCEAQ